MSFVDDGRIRVTNLSVAVSPDSSTPHDELLFADHDPIRLTDSLRERLLTHHCDRRRAGDRRRRVEDHAADAVDADRGRAGLHLGVVGVGRARNRDPVRGALRADHAALLYRPARYAERHGRRVHCVAKD